MEHAEEQRLNQEEETLQERGFLPRVQRNLLLHRMAKRYPPSAKPAARKLKEDAADGGSGGIRRSVVEELRQTIAAREEEINELSNRLLRLQADFDNYRKRVRTEKEQTQYATLILLSCFL